MSAYVLELAGVQVEVGGWTVLRGIDLTVAAGQATVLLGRNGAGKSAVLRTVCGLYRVSGGHMRWKGCDIRRARPDDMARRGVSYVAPDGHAFAQLTVKENLVLAARASGRLDASRVEWLFLLFPTLEQHWLHPAGSLSGGQQRLLAFAAALARPCELLMVDEPMQGLAPAAADSVLEALLQLKANGVALLIAEQDLALAQRVGNELVLMDQGTVSQRALRRVLQVAAAEGAPQVGSSV